MIYDISPSISEETAVWPGDIPFTRSWQSQFQKGAHMDLSSMTTTVHIGAHADAPSHYRSDGKSIDEVELEPYLGPCAVVTVEKPVITPSDCEKALGLNVPRILFRTLSQPDFRRFNTDFSFFAKEAVECMGRKGVLLIGIDTPSVDAFDSKELAAHQMLYKYGIRNLEGLVLKNVPDGIYELIALPLALKGFDASPVRAILRTR